MNVKDKDMTQQQVGSEELVDVRLKMTKKHAELLWKLFVEILPSAGLYYEDAADQLGGRAGS